MQNTNTKDSFDNYNNRVIQQERREWRYAGFDDLLITL